MQIVENWDDDENMESGSTVESYDDDYYITDDIESDDKYNDAERW